jgi:hypothetical protein
MKTSSIFNLNTVKALKSILFGITMFLAITSQAQVSVNVNIGSPPLWGPAGYTEARYYYLPDVEAYYDVPSSMFIYYDRGAWIHRTYLPSRYRNYDLYGGYKVVITDYSGNTPYTYFKEHKVKYARGYRGHEQKNIGERPPKEYSKARMNSGGHSNKESKHGNVRSGGNGNTKNMGKGHGGGKGKNK